MPKRSPDSDPPVQKIRIPINGVTQAMLLQSEHPERPVLLFLHGGPGMPEYWLTQHYPTGLEQSFTVAWWEQRGSGLSYDSAIAPETMTVEQFVADTLAVSEWLCERFGARKIYLLAHSWGSFITAAGRGPGTRVVPRLHRYGPDHPPDRVGAAVI